MKKYLLLILALVLFSCTKDDNDADIQSNSCNCFNKAVAVNSQGTETTVSDSDLFKGNCNLNNKITGERVNQDNKVIYYVRTICN
jgi:hypothetical protein